MDLQLQLTEAAGHGDVGEVERLLEAGADINAVDNDSYGFALQRAIFVGDTRMLGVP